MQLTDNPRASTVISRLDSRAQPGAAEERTTTHSRDTLRSSALLVTLTLATLLIHGYHPLAEDGGLYAAGIEWKLDPSLFPHFTEFVSEHLRFSIFAPLVAGLVRASHVSLLTVLFLLNLGSIGLTLAAGRALLRRITTSQGAQLAGVALLAALWTVPVAGTSLLLMDPYVTARTFSTPLSLFAIAFAVDDWAANGRSRAGCILAITVAAALHPLMAGYALGLIVVLRMLRTRRRFLLLSALAILAMAAAAFLQWHAPADSGAVALAARSRYYWFLSQWHWYELVGLAGPLVVLLALMRWNRSGLGETGRTLTFGCVLYGCFATAIALLFAHESYQAHIVARLQPLRVFLVIYAVMLLLLGASLHHVLERRAKSSAAVRLTHLGLAAVLLAAGLAMLFAERQTFPASPHIELPWRAENTNNAWVRAFLWCRKNTPRDALFALDAHYITAPDEDAQTFRAIAQRSALPDFSKDGGEASITPRLADEWQAGFTAQLNLDRQSAPQLRSGLAPFGVDWVILRSNSAALLACPYNNATVKVCQLAR